MALLFDLQVREGSGVYTYASKSSEDVPVTYEGQWKANKKSGIGIQIYENVGTYNGYWEEGERHGEGVMTYTNQDVYSGNWENGKKTGKGTYIFFKTHEKYNGIFKNGQMVNGKWLLPNGSYYEGNFNNNKPNGIGVWKFSNGNVVNGHYSQAKSAAGSLSEPAEIKLTWKTLK